MCVKRLLNNTHAIMDEVEHISLERLRKERSEGDGRCSEDDLTQKLTDCRNIFLVLDKVFALLRTPAPTEDEIKETEHAIHVLKKLWCDMKLNITPKAHVLFCHTLKQLKDYNGIADKVEDFVEKAHQDGKKLEDLVKRMPNQCFEAQNKVMFNRQ